MLNEHEPFIFFDTSYYVSRFLGCEFGIGAEAVQKLLHEVDINEEFDKIHKKKTKEPLVREETEEKK